MARTTDFDKEEIINKAMDVFWSKGYEGTSIKDLMNATGLLKGSIYNTFESKENLFILCLEKYGKNSRSFHYKEGDPSEYLKRFFTKLVNEGVDKNFTKGCMIMNSCLEFSEKETILLKKSKALFSATEKNIKNVLLAFYKEPRELPEIDKVKVSLLSAAFSIREISKFKKDRAFLKQIANNSLKELDLEI